MLIPRRTVRTSQPQHPVGIDRSNPITRGLAHHLSGIPGGVRNAVTGAISAHTGTPSIETTGKGRLTVYGAGSSTSIPNVTIGSSQEYTVSFLLRCDSLSHTAYPEILGINGWDGFNCHTQGDGVLYIGTDVVARIATSAGYISTADGLLLIHHVKSPSGQRLFKNGALTHSSGVNVTNTFGNATVAPNQAWRGIIDHISVSARSFSDAEVKAHAERFWQIFEDEEDYLFVPDASGGGSVSLIVADALHGHAVDSPSFSMATYLAVAESLHTQAADNLTLNTTGSANLAIQEAAHAHVSDGVALTTRWLLIVADALHTHAADNLTMGVTGATTLTVADATSVHTADSVALSVIAFLAIADAVSQHAADNLTLDTSNATFLTVQEATHSHGTDGIALTLDTWLAIVDAAHAHTADAPTLSLGQLSLQIADALHAMYSDIVFLTLPGGNLTTDQKFIIRATARRLAAIGLARNNIINRRAS